jgi:hypothetical protein
LVSPFFTVVHDFLTRQTGWSKPALMIPVAGQLEKVLKSLKAGK